MVLTTALVCVVIFMPAVSFSMAGVDFSLMSYGIKNGGVSGIIDKNLFFKFFCCFVGVIAPTAIRKYALFGFRSANLELAYESGRESAESKVARYHRFERR